jgi:hypothetical protein
MDGFKHSPASSSSSSSVSAGVASSLMSNVIQLEANNSNSLNIELSKKKIRKKFQIKNEKIN